MFLTLIRFKKISPISRYMSASSTVAVRVAPISSAKETYSFGPWTIRQSEGDESFVEEQQKQLHF